MHKEFVARKADVTAKAKETGKTVLETIIGYPILPTISDCDSDHKLADNKIAGLNVAHVKMGGKVEDAIDKTTKLEQQLDKELGSADSKKVDKAMKAVKKLRQALEKSLGETETLGARVKGTERALDAVGKVLKKVQEGQGTYLKVFEKAFPIAYGLAMAAATAGAGFSEASSALDHANAGIGLGKDMLDLLKDNLD